MTTPSPPPQQAGQPPPQQEDDGLGDTALALAIAALLAGATVTAAYASSVAGMLAVLKGRFRLSKAAWSALGALLSMVTRHPHAATGVIGPASAQVSSMNAARRAQYVTAASRRVLAAERQARAKGESTEAARAKALETERRYFQQHQKAMWDRAAAAGKIDMEAAVHGSLLGWYAMVRDKSTTPECRAAHRHNFYVDSPPKIGLPGVVHVGCRCEPGPPWPRGKLLPGSGPRYARAAA